jgi:hypothetical protein
MICVSVPYSRDSRKLIFKHIFLFFVCISFSHYYHCKYPVTHFVICYLRMRLSIKIISSLPYSNLVKYCYYINKFTYITIEGRWIHTCRRRNDEGVVSWGLSPQGQIVCDLDVWLFTAGVRYYVTVRMHFHNLPFRVCFQ